MTFNPLNAPVVQLNWKTFDGCKLKTIPFEKHTDGICKSKEKKVIFLKKKLLPFLNLRNYFRMDASTKTLFRNSLFLNLYILWNNLD